MACDIPKCSPGRTDSAFIIRSLLTSKRAQFSSNKNIESDFGRANIAEKREIRKKENNRRDVIGRFSSFFIVEYCPGVRFFMTSLRRMHFWCFERKCETNQRIYNKASEHNSKHNIHSILTGKHHTKQ